MQQLLTVLGGPDAALLVEESSLPLGTGDPGLSPETLLAGKLRLQELFQLKGKLSAQETVLLLRTLFQLPKDIQTFLALLAGSPEGLTPETAQKLLASLSEQSVSPEQVALFLAEQGKTAGEKLLKLIQSNQTAFTGESASLGELLSLVHQVRHQSQHSQEQAMNFLLQIYLPWYPLVMPQQMDIEIVPEGKKEEAGESENPALVLYLQTGALGNFKMIATAETPNQVALVVFHQPVATSYLKELESQLAQAVKPHGLLPPLISAQVSLGPAQRPEGKVSPSSPVQDSEASAPHQITVQGAVGLPATVVLVAYTLVRLIFEKDQTFQLTEKRRQAIEGEPPTP